MNSATFFFLYILPLRLCAGVWSAIWISDAHRARRYQPHIVE